MCGCSCSEIIQDMRYNYSLANDSKDEVVQGLLANASLLVRAALYGGMASATQVSKAYCVQVDLVCTDRTRLYRRGCFDCGWSPISQCGTCNISFAEYRFASASTCSAWSLASMHRYQ